MSFIDSVANALRKFSAKPSLEGVKESMAPIKLPSEQAINSYESRYDDRQTRPPVDMIREPQIPAEKQFPLPQRPAQEFAPQYAQPEQPSSSPKIDLILAEIETVKAQLKVLSEKLDILENHYRH
ncbi:MAG: hypothetical protein V1836_03400 [Candidatus Aenigmatarchaeota archaeon]